jgi:hypothetical protein
VHEGNLKIALGGQQVIGGDIQVAAKGETDAIGAFRDAVDNPAHDQPESVPQDVLVDFGALQAGPGSNQGRVVEVNA